MKVRDILKYMGYYIEMKDKVLWEGSQASGSITVPGLDNYEEIGLVNIGYREIICRRDGRNNWIGLDGIGLYSENGHVTYEMQLIQNGDTLEFNQGWCNYMTHLQNGGHLSKNPNIYAIIKIIGKEPKHSAILEKIGGGGVLNLAVSLLLRGTQYVKTHLDTQDTWAAIQSTLYREQKIYNATWGKWIKDLLGFLWRCNVRFRDYTSHHFCGRNWNGFSDLQHRFNNDLQFQFQLCDKKHEPICSCGIRCSYNAGINLTNACRDISSNWLLKTRGWSYV